MPATPPEKTINCAVCGIEVVVQRLSARYCQDCKPKALVLNTVVKTLNRLVNVDPLTFADLIDINVPVTPQMMDAFEILEAVNNIGLLGVLNIALSDYGRIGYMQGSGFKVVADPSQRTIRAGGLREYVTSGHAPSMGGLNYYITADGNIEYAEPPSEQGPRPTFIMNDEMTNMNARAVFDRLVQNGTPLNIEGQMVWRGREVESILEAIGLDEQTAREQTVHMDQDGRILSVSPRRPRGVSQEEINRLITGLDSVAEGASQAGDSLEAAVTPLTLLDQEEARTAARRRNRRARTTDYTA